MARIATTAMVQHHPPQVVRAAPPILQGALGAKLTHGKLHGILHVGNALHHTTLLIPLHDMQTV